MNNPNPRQEEIPDPATDLRERAGALGRLRHGFSDGSRAREALEKLADERTMAQVAVGTAIIRSAGAQAIAAINARAIEPLAAVQLGLDARVAGAIESAGIADERTIVSSAALRCDEVRRATAAVVAGSMTEDDAAYAQARANARHADRLERSGKRYARLADGFDGAAAEAARRTGDHS